MSVDWSKYPPLPEPPKLPEWRDTPEHEAYWKEVDAIKTPMEENKTILCIFAVIWILYSAIFIWLFLFGRESILGSILVGIIVGYYFTYCPWVICNKIFYRIAKHKISKRYGFSMKKLNRPDISGEIRKILATRHDFDEAEFCKYWPAGQEQYALSVLKIAKIGWYLHKKMLYPNDPLLLLFYGRTQRFSREKMITDNSIFFESAADLFDIYDFDSIDNASTLAEFVEFCQKTQVTAE